MRVDILRLFLEEDCDQHARSVLLAVIEAKGGSGGSEDLTFDRFNVRLDFANNQVVIDDELNPDFGERRLSLDELTVLVSGNGGT